MALSDVQEQIAQTFGAHFPPGTPAIFVDDYGKPHETVIRSRPWVIADNSIIVLIERKSGGVLLDRVVPYPNQNKPDTTPVAQDQAPATIISQINWRPLGGYLNVAATSLQAGLAVTGKADSGWVLYARRNGIWEEQTSREYPTDRSYTPRRIDGRWYWVKPTDETKEAPDGNRGDETKS